MVVNLFCARDTINRLKGMKQALWNQEQSSHKQHELMKKKEGKEIVKPISKQARESSSG